MNKQDKSIEIFSRIANYVVSQQIKNAKGSASYEYVQDLINTTNMINQTLMLAAIKLIRKAQEKGANSEMLTEPFKNIIHSSVSRYPQSYS